MQKIFSVMRLAHFRFASVCKDTKNHKLQKLEHVYLFCLRHRNNFHIFLSLTVNCDSLTCNTAQNCPWRCFIIANGFWYLDTEFEFHSMKVFSEFQLEKCFAYSPIRNCAWVCHFVSNRKTPTSLLDKCKRMT